MTSAAQHSRSMLSWAALAWAADGVAVFPCHTPEDGGCSCGDPACRNTGKHPRTPSGVHDATTDPEAVGAWWERWPDANIGGATGAPSGVWVLDVDGPEGEAALADLEHEHGPLPETMATRTGKGRHLFWLMPDERPVKNRARVRPGLDVRGTGGYVLLPPSLHASGRRYEPIGDARPGEAPGWLLDLVAPVAEPASPPPAPASHRPPIADGEPGTPRARVLGMAAAAAERIRSTPEGSRNNAVNEESYRIGGYLDAAGMSVDEVAGVLEDAAIAADQPPRMVRRALEDGRNAPRGLPPDSEGWGRRDEGGELVVGRWARPTREADAPRGDEPIPGGEHAERAIGEAVGSRSSPRWRVDIAALARLPYTDLGNARRLDARHGIDLRWSETHRNWLVWTGAHWEWDQHRRAHQLAQATVEAISEEVAFFEAEARALGKPEPGAKLSAEQEIARDRVKAARAWARASQAGSRIAATYGEARALPGRAVSPDELDADPWLLNVANGTLDLRTGDLRPHRRADLICRVVPVVYDPTVGCPRWMGALGGILPDEDVRRMFQRGIGYSLTGAVSEQVWFLLQGEGSNGKSTVLDIIQCLLGRYAVTLPSGVLERQPHEAHPTELVDLHGARFAAGTEPQKGKQWDAEKVKRLTGGDRVKARAMRKDFFEFVPTHKLWVACNDAPSVDDTSHGFWRRIVVIPFAVQFRRPDEPEDGRPLADKSLSAALRAELPGILNWALEGLAAWRRGGLQVPKACQAATQQYRAEQDDIARFVEECCDREDGFSTSTADLYVAYRVWHDGQGLTGRPRSKVQFGKALTGLGFLSFEGRARQAMRSGIRLAPPCSAKTDDRDEQP